MFLSLLLGIDYVQGATWHVEADGKTEIEATATEPAAATSWEERIISADQVIGRLEETTPDIKLQKVVLGLPSAYLTDAGDIQSEVRPQIKKLTQELGLTPIGFVSLPQALVHKLKLDEGVPPSVILIGVNSQELTVSLYKIGSLMGQTTLKKEDAVTGIENFLKSFKGLEVLPSRMLLYGVDEKELDDVKRALMKHPWPTRANFLHFPKIDSLPLETGVRAVSLAGASEISKALGEEEAQVSVAPREEVIAQPTVKSEGKEALEGKTEDKEMLPEETEQITEEEPAEVVEPEALGFKKSEDVLEVQSEKFKVKSSEEEELEEEERELDKRKFHLPFKLPVFELAPLLARLQSISVRGVPVTLIALVVLSLLFFGGYYWFLPQATVTVLEIPKPIDEEVMLTIDPTATVADGSSKIIPGKKQEQEVSGEKVIAVTGKKQVGDPAKGAVTIYNKDVTSSKTFPKGIVLTASSLKFTLDGEVQVASASQTSIDTITFGKATANITASAIGTQSNLPAGTQFDFQDYATNIAIARNDQALSGGTSRDITVVSRADYDSLVEALTDELVQKAKTNLGGSVGGREKLIEDTIKASVSSKNFTEEIDQEAKQLHGKLTVTVSGISYNEDDVAAVIKGALGANLPNGYVFAPTETSIKLASTQMKKNGTVVTAVQFHAVAVPTLDLEVIRKALAGKKIAAAQDYLRQMTGVGGVEFGFRWTPFKDRLPANQKNISVTVAIQ